VRRPDSRRSAFAVAAALALAAAVVLTVGAAACGGGGGGQSSQTATERFAAILGHQPSGLAATVARRGTLVVGEDPEFAPQSSVDSTGAWSGFDVDVARRVAAVLGLKVEFRQLDWARVPAALAADRYDVAISSIATDPAPEGKLALTAPYAYTTAQVAVPQGAAPISTLGELKGKTIGASASTTFQQFLEAAGGVGVALYQSDADALPDVANGTLAGAMTADTTAATERAAGAQIAATGAGFFYQPQAFATRQGEADFVAALNSAVKTMRTDGTLGALSRKWYHGLDVSARPGAGVPDFSKALALLKAGTYPLQ
jgi:ABC-type amino acid transport substrate-binding protein